MSETENKNLIWGLVHVGHMTFIGAFRDYVVVGEGGELPSGDAGAELERAAILQIERDFENGKTIHLEPVMELQAPLQQVRQQTPGGERVGVAKPPLAMPYGFTTGRTALRLLYPNAYTFINEMSEGDQRIYRGFIDSVFKAELEERAARSGLTLSPGLTGAGRG